MFIHQTNNVIDGACIAPPQPNDGNWFEVPDDDPRCIIEMPIVIEVSPVDKLKEFLAVNPDVMAILK